MPRQDGAPPGKLPHGVFAYGMLFVISFVFSWLNGFFVHEPHPTFPQTFPRYALPWVLLVAGIGLLAQKEWGRKLTVALSGLGAAYLMYAALYRVWLWKTQDYPIRLMAAIVVDLCLVSSSFIYFTRSSVKAHFRGRHG